MYGSAPLKSVSTDDRAFTNNLTKEGGINGLIKGTRRQALGVR